MDAAAAEVQRWNVKITDFLDFEPYATPLGLRTLQGQRILIENPQSKQRHWNTDIKKRL